MTATWRYRKGTEAVFSICCSASGSMSCGGKKVTILLPILNIDFLFRNQHNRIVNSVGWRSASTDRSAFAANWLIGQQRDPDPRICPRADNSGTYPTVSGRREGVQARYRPVPARGCRRYDRVRQDGAGEFYRRAACPGIVRDLRDRHGAGARAKPGRVGYPNGCLLIEIPTSLECAASSGEARFCSLKNCRC